MYNLPSGITNSWRILLSSTSNLGDALSFKGRKRQGTENDLTLPDLWPRLKSTNRWIDLRNRGLDPGCSKVSAPMRQLPPVALPRHFQNQGAPSSEKITGSVGFLRLDYDDYDESQTSHKKSRNSVASFRKVTHITIRQLQF